MHTTYHKISARERDTAPRFYYKRTHKYTCFDRIKLVIRKLITFLFTQVGVCALVACYMATGAFVFASIEADSQMEQAVDAQKTRQKFVFQLWNVTLHTNVIYRKEWKDMTDELLLQFQKSVVLNVKKGYTGNEVGVRVWTFSSALMYSLTVFTTIGYGNLTPKTDIGKLTTIFYALAGIPLMLLYMSTIGSILATSFKYTYTKLCRCRQPSRTMPAKASLPSALVEVPTQPSDSEKQSKHSSSRSNNSSSDNKSLSPLKHFKSIRKKQIKSNDEIPVSPTSDLSVTPFRRPSIIVQNAVDYENSPNESNLNPQKTPSPATNSFLSPFASGNSPGSYFLKTPAFLKSSMTPIMDRRNKGNPPSSPSSFRTDGETSAGEEMDVQMEPSPPPPPKMATVEFKLVEDLRLVTIPVTSCLVVLAAYIFLGTVLFSNWEGWNYLDGAYFCFISLMTIGFGDFVPGNKYIYQVTDDINEESSKAKLVIGTIYILLGMAILAMCLNLMQEQIVVQVRTAARRLGLIRPTRYDDQDDL